MVASTESWNGLLKVEAESKARIRHHCSPPTIIASHAGNFPLTSAPALFPEHCKAHSTAMDSAYKADKEAFVSGLTGSTVGHINAISLLVAFVRPASPHPFHALN